MLHEASLAKSGMDITAVDLPAARVGLCLYSTCMFFVLSLPAASRQQDTPITVKGKESLVDAHQKQTTHTNPPKAQGDFFCC